MLYKHPLFSLLILFMVMGSTNAIGQSLSGRIVDAETLRSLQGANITANGTSFATTTDHRGRFTIESSQNIDTLRISYIGYEPRLVTLRQIRKQANIRMQPVYSEFSALVVTGTYVEVARRNVPLTVSSITSEELRRSGESALLPVLSEQVPGLFVTERGVTGFGVAAGSAGQISIRGLGGSPTTRVLVMIDGNPQFMGLMGHPLPDNYVTSDARKVEVIRGPASVLYGSNAMGGVINIITQKPASNGLHLNANASYGSHNTRKLMGSAGYRHNRLDIFGSINHNYSDGHRPHSEFDITNGYLKAGYRLSPRFQLGGDFRLAAFEAADPGPSYGQTGERIDILRGKGSLSLDNKFSTAEGALKLYYNFGTHDVTDGWHSDDYLYGLMAHQAFTLTADNTLTAGYDHMKFGGNGAPIITVIRNDQGNPIPGPDGRPQFRPSPISGEWISSSRHAFYFFDQHTFDSVTLTGGLRYEINSDYHNAWIPQLGLAWQLQRNTTLKSSISRGYRPPSLRELYLFPPANDDLQPERSWNYEIGWIQRWPDIQLRTELTAFRSEGDNLIIQQAPPYPPRYNNSGSFTNTGLELSLQYRPASTLKFRGNYAWIHMSDPLTATPEHNLFISGHYTPRRWHFSLKAHSIRNLYGLDAQGSISRIIDHYVKLDARGEFEVSEAIKLFVSLENLLDQQYQTLDGYPMPGTTVFGGIAVEIQ